MSAPPMGVCLLLALSLCAVAVLALSPCYPYVPVLLRTTPSCYKGGVAPSQTAPANETTFVHISKDDLSPNTGCIYTYVKNNLTYVTTFLQPGKSTRVYHRKVRRDHLFEIAYTREFFKLFVIHNEDHVFSYYRCILSPTTKKTPMVVIAIDCNFLNDPKAREAVKRSKKCFKDLGFVNTMNLTPCGCAL